MVKNSGKSLRTVLQIGESTGITLPAKYLDESGLNRGDQVEVIFRGETVHVKPLRLDKKGVENSE